MLSNQLTVADVEKILQQSNLDDHAKAMAIIALHRVDMTNLLNYALNQFSETVDDLRKDI